MKDRWKILIASIVIGSIFGIFLLFLGFSFKVVGLKQYGILKYSFFKTVDPSQSVRKSGNYLVGIDYEFITYPRGILSHKFTIDILTKDKSIISVQGIFLGQLIESQIINLHFNYGPDAFLDIIFLNAEYLFRQSLQQFYLKQIITDRYNINEFVSNNVCLNIQSKYSFVDCQYVSTSNIQIYASPVNIPQQLSIQQQYLSTILKTIQMQKKLNIYSTGGYDLISSVQKSNAQLFYNISQLILNTVNDFNSTQYLAAAMYILNVPYAPKLNNTIVANF